MPLQATSGAASYDAFGGGVPVVPTFVEDVFSTYLYKGNSSTQSIVNNIDLSTKGGLVWFKNREDTNNNFLIDTVRGVSNYIRSNQTSAEGNFSPLFSSFNTNGFSLNGTSTDLNSSSYNYVSWTFRKQPKFFDVVTYTGTGGALSVNHGLTSQPGAIFIKRTDSTSNWFAFCATGSTYYASLYLNLTNNGGTFNLQSTYASTTSVNIGAIGTNQDAAFNVNGATYVMYLFASNAGGFGLTGTDNVISCGSYVGDGSGNAVVNLGYEPQFLLVKLAQDFAEEWRIFDTMRGWDNSTSQGSAKQLVPNTSAAETTRGGWKPTATGFEVTSQSSGLTVIYIAIRRGPMKVPTVGTSVFAPLARTGSGTNPTVVTTGTNPDLLLSFPRTASPAAYGTVFFDKLRGVSQILQSANTNAEATTAGTFVLQSFLNTGFQTGADFIQGYLNYSGSTYAQYAMTRAPGFFDEVCYTGTGSAATINHNLGVVPDLIIIKNRGAASTNWAVNVRIVNTNNWVFNLEEDTARFNNALFSSAPTSTTMTFTGAQVNATSNLYVAYLFATCAGVSKVGSYTGNGSSQTIDCGFSAGARFVLIKRNNDIGDWYVWDTARGIVSGNDPHLSLNTTAAEVTTDDTIDTNSTGFVVNQVAATNVNVSSGTYIFLAIA